LAPWDGSQSSAGIPVGVQGVIFRCKTGRALRALHKAVRHLLHRGMNALRPEGPSSIPSLWPGYGSEGIRPRADSCDGVEDIHRGFLCSASCLSNFRSMATASCRYSRGSDGAAAGPALRDASLAGIGFVSGPEFLFSRLIWLPGTAPV
jgi:hypothetical protein